MKKILIYILLVSSIFAQIGDLIWEENFNDLDNWIKITGNGSWGWGNGELEYYKEENVEISSIPDEPSNNALHITAKSESGPDITDQWGNPLFYTSGKVISKSNVSIKYGVVETRVRIPDLDVGGWPAVWLLGTSNYAWPRNGELDMMEMGSRQSFRDLHDDHNGGNGLNNSNVNQVVGANAIFYSDEALTADNPSGAASISWDPDDDNCRPYYNYENPLNDRFVIYRMYWDNESIRFTVIDNQIEYDLYEGPMQINEESDEFQNPFYLIANLAIGGLFTDAEYLGGNGLPISMPLPASMYIDYIKVYEWNEQGEVILGPPNAENGTVGIFTDNTDTNNSLEVGVDSEIYVWEETLSDGSISPYEGSNGITWSSTGLGWFGAGIMSVQPINLSNFEDGFLKFMIKIPANISFQIGIIDAWGNQSYVDFEGNQTTYGLTRDGNWGQASIPISEIRGEFIDLRMLTYEFVILEVNGASCEFAIDDIYWDGGYDPCTDVVCEEGEVCDNGDCVDIPIDPCEDITCEEGEICDNGNCVDIPVDPCEDVTCNEDQTCDDGDCVDIPTDPCEDIICEDGQICEDGNCVGNVHIDLPVDFEGSTVNYTMSDFGGNMSSLVTDPFASNNMVIEIVKTNQAATWAGTTIGTPSGFATNIPFSLTNSVMTVKVWSPQAGIPIRLKVEDSNDNTHTCETETNTTISGWQVLEFDFTNQAPGTESLSTGLGYGWTYNMASIFFNFGTEGSGETYYFDDVQMCNNGDCIDPCEDITCDDGQVCSNGDCVDIPPDPCEDIMCDDGQICDNGDCVDISIAPTVTFLVDMQNEDVDETGVYVSGSDPQLVGPSGLLMSNQGNDIWSLTMEISPGTYTYKFRNGFYDYWDGPGWEPDLPAECGFGEWNDRQFTFSNIDLVLGPYFFGSCELSETDDTLGDINFDGIINVIDVVILVNGILGGDFTEEQLTVADFNGDGNINIVDVVQLVSLILN